MPANDSPAKEYTFTLGQISLFIMGILLPGLGIFYTMRERVVTLEQNQVTQSIQAKKIEDKLDNVQETLTNLRLEVAGWPKQAKKDE